MDRQLAGCIVDKNLLVGRQNPVYIVIIEYGLGSSQEEVCFVFQGYMEYGKKISL